MKRTIRIETGWMAQLRGRLGRITAIDGECVLIEFEEGLSWVPMREIESTSQLSLIRANAEGPRVVNCSGIPNHVMAEAASGY